MLEWLYSFRSRRSVAAKPSKKDKIQPAFLQSRFSYISPWSLTPLSPEAVTAGRATGVSVTPPGAERTFPWLRPEFHDDPDGVGLIEDLAEVLVRYPPIFMLSAVNCALVGYRTILAEGGIFFNDDALSG